VIASLVRPAGASGAAGTLLVGRTIGFAVAFGIPMVLESLYYFVPRQSGRAGRPVANALLTLAVVGLAAAAVMTFAPDAVSHVLESDSTSAYMPLLGAFLALTLFALPLETVMVSRKEYGTAAVTYAVSDTVRAALFMLPGLVTQSLTAVLVGAVAFGVLRVLALFGYVLSAFRSELRLDRLVWREQIAYALPFSIAVFIETAQLNLHQFVVWHRFDPTIFAIYSAGCLQVPLVELLITSVGNVMMVQMGENAAAKDKALVLWHRAVSRLAFVLWPLVVALVLTSRDLIVTLYTSAYAASAPIFAIATLIAAQGAMPVDSVLRVYAQTTFLIVMNVIRLIIVGLGIGVAIAWFGLQGAIGITVFSLAATKLLGIWRVAHVLQVSMRRVLPWRTLAGIAALALGAAVPAWLVSIQFTAMPPLAHGALVASVYGVTYFGLDLIVRPRGPVLPIRTWLSGRT
jgi:O-antigen/teichoic acid export membrane protein